MNLFVVYLLAAFLKWTASQTLSIDKDKEGQSLLLKCVTIDFSSAISFLLNSVSRGGCSPLVPCDSELYETPSQSGQTTTMQIKTCNLTRDEGNWTCTYGASTSPVFAVSSCPSSSLSSSSDNEDWHPIILLLSLVLIDYGIITEIIIAVYKHAVKEKCTTKKFIGIICAVGLLIAVILGLVIDISWYFCENRYNLATIIISSTIIVFFLYAGPIVVFCYLSRNLNKKKPGITHMNHTSLEQF